MITKLLRVISSFILFFMLANLCIAAEHIYFKIQGVDQTVEQNIQKRLSILKKSTQFLGTNQLAQLGISEIRQAMQPFGYFKPIIYSAISAQSGSVIITYQIKPGPAVIISTIDIKLLGPGKDNFKLIAYVKNFPLKTGDVFVTPQYDKAKEDLFNIANNEGYIKNYLAENKIYINLKTDKASIVLHLQTGSLYHFGKITFSKSPYSEAFLQRFMAFKHDEHFSNQKLVDLQQKMSESSYFQQVQITPNFDQAIDNKVPVNVDVLAPKSQQYNIGIGYGTLMGPRLTAGVDLRRLNDSGHHFDAQLKLSSVLSGIAGKYYIPGHNPLTDQWIIGANYQRFLPDSGSSTSGTVSVGYLKKINHWQAGIDLNYLVERYKVNDDLQEINKLLYPNFTLYYVKTDDLLYPHEGRLFNLILRGASEAFYSSTNFFQGQLTGKYLFSPTSFSQFVLRGSAGYTVVHDIKNLPLSMRFFAGGNNSIRGYKDSSIGPGRYLKTGSIEYRNHIVGNWTGALFYDLGTAADHWSAPMHHSEGVGTIYQSLIGPVRVYVAKALDRSKPYSFEFSIGPEFS